MSKRFLLSGAFLLLLVGAVLIGAGRDTLPPWGGGAAEARTAVLSGGMLTPFGGGGQPASPAAAPGPGGMTFQGRLTSPATGNAVADGNYDINFEIFDLPTGGTSLWSTSLSPLVVTGGLFTVDLTEADDFPPGLFDGAPRYLEIRVLPDPPMTPRLPFLSVPYAFHADVSELAADAADVNCTACVHPSDVEFNYAASQTQNGPASDLSCFAPAGCVSGSEIIDGQVGSNDIANDSITSTDVAFNYAGSFSEGGAANDVSCPSPLSCISGNEIVDDTITTSDIASNTITSTDIALDTITSGDIALDTITSADIALDAITSADIALDTITAGDIAAGAIGSSEIADNTITATDLNFPYALSASEAGDASNSQLLDNVDSASFLRSDTSDQFTSGTLSMNSGTILDLRNAGASSGIRLSNNGGEGQMNICFFEGIGPCDRFLRWDNSGDRFQLNDSLFADGSLAAVNGDIFFGTSEGWLDGGADLIRSLDSLRMDGAPGIGGLCLDNGFNGPPVDECDEFMTASASIWAEGTITVGALGAAGATALCRNASNEIATCSSSARYKDDIAALPFDGEKLLALRPVQFQWKENGEPGVGLVAEEVAELIPELVTYNENGEVEGVRYEQLSVYLLEMLKQHQKELAELRAGESGGETPAAPASGGSVDTADLALVLALAIAAAAVIAAGTTFAIVRSMRTRQWS
jgi:hypothetical protein